MSVYFVQAASLPYTRYNTFQLPYYLCIVRLRYDGMWILHNLQGAVEHVISSSLNDMHGESFLF